MAPSPILQTLNRLVADLRQRAARAELVTFEKYHLVMEVTTGVGGDRDPVTEVRIALVREPVSVEQPVEEDVASFVVTPAAITELRFTRSGFDRETTSPRERSPAADRELVDQIRAFFAAGLPEPEPER